MQEMFHGLTEADLASMPAFPFPKELFPPDTFPPGVQFSEEGLNMLPPSVRELVETGQASSLGLMFQSSSEQLQPGFDSLLTLLMGRDFPSNGPGLKWKSKRRMADVPVDWNADVPVDFDFEAIGKNFDFLSSLSEQELADKVMGGGLGLVGLGDGGMIHALQGFDTCTLSDTGSESRHSDLESEHSESRSAESVAASDVEAELADGGRGGDWGSEAHSARDVQATVLIQEIQSGDGHGVASQASGAEDCFKSGVCPSTVPVRCDSPTIRS